MVKYLPSHLTHFLLPSYLSLRKFFFKPQIYTWDSFQWNHFYFSNPLGIAGGLDKSADSIEGWWTYGVGFIEIGTITPKKQTPHTGSILKKNNSKKALWNYMGFPNKGVQHACENLKKIKKPYVTPIFANLGKNRTTPNDKAFEEYLFLMDQLSPYVDGFTINISSPNTQNLRDLFKPDILRNFLSSLVLKSSKPILLKISPDLSKEEFLNVIQISDQEGVQGWVLCNSTLQRNSRTSFPTHGGVSGKPLASISKHFLKLLVDYLKERRNSKLIVSCGGVLSPEDVYERLRMGAHLVQAYSALVFEGPSFFKKTYQKTLKKVKAP